MKYGVILEKSKGKSYGAYAPALPGLGVIDKSREKALKSFALAFSMHIEALLEQKEKLPIDTLRYRYDATIEYDKNGSMLVLETQTSLDHYIRLKNLL